MTGRLEPHGQPAFGKRCQRGGDRDGRDGRGRDEVQRGARRREDGGAGGAGGGLDSTGRALETALRDAKLFSESFAIKNVGGAGGNVARTQVNQKKGDSHVLYVESKIGRAHV